MRNVISLCLASLLAPLSACYVGSGTSHAPSAAPHADAAPPPADAAPPSQAQCAHDEDCGDNAVCVLDSGNAHCAMRPPAAQPCADVCHGRVCGEVDDPTCGHVSCGGCLEGHACSADGARCALVADGLPRWEVHIESVHVSDCSTHWDRCNFPGFCSMTLPDPYVSFRGRTTGSGSNTCDVHLDHDAGALLESDLRSGVTAAILDDDSPSTSDVICGDFAVTFTDEDFAAGRKVAMCPNGSVTFTLSSAM